MYVKYLSFICFWGASCFGHDLPVIHVYYNKNSVDHYIIPTGIGDETEAQSM